MNFDLLFKNSRVIDGSGNPWYNADLGVNGETISRISRNGLSEESAKEVIDLEGKTLCPGFVDIHSHSDCNFLADPEASSKLRQGVTTELAGNCGKSSVPFSEEMGFSDKIFEEIGEVHWEDFPSFFSKLRNTGLPINLGTFVGHGSIRAKVMGFEAREPTSAELEQMKGIVERNLKDGAFGLSTGLYYAPGSYASTEEVIELAKTVSKHGGIYASHIRNEGRNLLESVEEAIQIGEEAQVPVEISHHKAVGEKNWGKVVESLEIIRQARARGVEVTCDQYPYTASSTSLASFLPRWAQKGGREKCLTRLENKDEVKKIKKELGSDNVGQTDWSAVKIVELPEDNDQSLVGKNVQEIAEERGKEALQTVVDLLIESRGKARQVHFGISEDDMKKVMAQPFVMVGSDGSSLKTEGPLSFGKPHPRSYGTFPRVLGKFVREENILPLEEAIRKMTSFPAQKIGLKTKGQIKEGMDADLVVFSPEEIEDKADFHNPHQYPSGIYHVLVNGKFAVKNGENAEYGAGKVLQSTVT